MVATYKEHIIIEPDFSISEEKGVLFIKIDIDDNIDIDLFHNVLKNGNLEIEAFESLIAVYSPDYLPVYLFNITQSKIIEHNIFKLCLFFDGMENILIFEVEKESGNN